MSIAWHKLSALQGWEGLSVYSRKNSVLWCFSKGKLHSYYCSLFPLTFDSWLSGCPKPSSTFLLSCECT